MNFKRLGLFLPSFVGLRRSAVMGLLFCVPLPVLALEVIDDEALSRLDAQDGIVLQLNFGPSSASSPGTGVSLDRLYWEDKAGVVLGTAAATAATNTTLRGYAENVTLYGKGMGATLALDFGTYNGHPGFNFDVSANIGTAFGRSFRVCDGTGPTAWSDGCGISLGALTIQTSDTSPLHFNLKTSDGLFNQTSVAKLLADIHNVNVYFNQAVTFSDPNGSTNNQAILRNFNFNFLGTGYAFLTDAAGLVFQTNCPTTCDSLGLTTGVTLNRVTDPTYTSDTLPGLNLELMYKANSGNPTIATNYSLTGAKGLIHLGASGDMTNASFVLRGTDATGTTGDASVLGMAAAASGTASTLPIVGAGGLAMGLSAAFKRDGSNPVTLELGHAGTNAFGVQFGNLSPLQIRTGCAASGTGCTALNSALATFTSGNVYVNLAATKKLSIPQNATLNSVPMGGSYLTTAADYSFDAHGSSTSNPNMVVLAIRDMEFNSISRNSRFIVSNDVTDATVKNSGDLTGFYTAGTSTWTAAGSSWGLGLPFYKVNVDAAFYGATGGALGSEQRIGMGFALSTTGRDGVYNSTTPSSSTDTTKTTSILLIDGAPNANDTGTGCPVAGCPTNYYIGVRNIDMYMAGMGSIGLNGDSTITATNGLNIDIDKFTLALSGEVAAGYLPGSKVKSAGITQYAPSNSFTLKDDVLFGIRLKMAGDANLVITPGDSSSLETGGKATNYPRLLGNLNLSSGALQLVEPVDGTILGFDNICGGSSNNTAVGTYYTNPCGSGGATVASVGLNNYIRINRDSVDFGYTLNFNPTNSASNVFRMKDVEMFAADGSGGLQARQRLGEMVLTGGTLATQLTLKPR